MAVMIAVVFAVVKKVLSAKLWKKSMEKSQ